MFSFKINIFSTVFCVFLVLKRYCITAVLYESGYILYCPCMGRSIPYYIANRYKVLKKKEVMLFSYSVTYF